MTKKTHNAAGTADIINLSRRSGLARLSAHTTALMGSRAMAPLFLAGSSSLAAAGSAAAAACVLSPEGRTGPFYTSLDLVRSDVTEGLPGVILELNLMVRNSACQPLVGAAVALWNCSSRGMYSVYPNVNPDVPGYVQVPLGQVPPEAPHYPEQDTSQRFLRGVLLTDSLGCVRFRDLYPSWYATRTPHVHVKVYPAGAVGGPVGYTGQLYFPEAVNTTVLANPLYTGRTLPRDTMNNTDRHYVAMGGARNELQISSTPYGLRGVKTLMVPV